MTCREAETVETLTIVWHLRVDLQHNDNTLMKSPNLPLVRPRSTYESGAAFECLVRRRRRAREIAPVSLHGALSASIARSPEEVRAAAALVEARYAERGYRVVADDDQQETGITLIATEGDAVLGTLTLRFDGPHGLGADESYGEAVDAVRRSGRDVCELTRLAVEPSADSRSVLSALFGLAYVIGRHLHGVTDVFVEVNPRHAAFYRRMFGFATAAGRKICPRVMAPAVLLRLELERLEEMLADSGVLGGVVLDASARHALAA